MGNSLPNLKACFFSGRRRRETAVVTSEPYDDGLGHSFCYRSKMGRSDEAGSTAFRSISGASLSANAATPLSTAMDSGACAAFQSSTCFSSGPIEPAGLLSGPPDRPSLRRTLSRGLRRALTRPSVSADRLHWAQGRAGEDRVHVVVSEPQGSLFVGIYDGFNGPDATDYLLSNLYPALQTQLQGLLWEETHAKVLKALSLALKNTEEAFLETADMIASQNPELALMGSCVLVMLMKGEHLYLMNVGDSRAVLAKFPDPLINLDSIVEDSVAAQINAVQNLVSCQLTEDHSTSVEEEVKRIRSEHPEDASAIVNERVKGSLKVTRAFGAGFLKKPKWNNALLEMFRIDYVGTSPYITCSPFLFHHRLSSRDRFIILSSDGLYQYFTNEEAVSEVESFMSTNPAGDPAQHLVEEVLVRAAKNAGMDFHELLEISQGDRRRYHDDVSIIVISFEGRIWRSCM